MYRREHVLVAYGQELGYHHGAKFQILSAWENWYSKNDVSVCVVTDKPELFEGYPIRLLPITAEDVHEWSLGGLQHFGIKLKAFEYSMKTSTAPISVLLDTDTYWIKNPDPLLDNVCENSAIMFCDEGQVSRTRNVSINRFNEALSERVVKWGKEEYQMSPKSRMLNSSIIGLHNSNIQLLEQAFELFRALEPIVDAHTVEQFAVAEIFRLNRLELTFGSKYTRDWSSIGRKNYATPLLKKFFDHHGENDFKNHLKFVRSIPIRRPLTTFLEQKISKVWK